jgi:NTE family protein
LRSGGSSHARPSLASAVLAALSPFQENGLSQRPVAKSKPSSRARKVPAARAAKPKPGGARERVAVDLALQGGGAHGAFTWGVLDRLLEETWLDFDGISGTSAGAMNAVVMVDGHAAGGMGSARRSRLSGSACPMREDEPAAARSAEILTAPDARLFADARGARHGVALVSPYDIRSRPSADPDFTDSVDFSRLAAAPIKLFTPTNVRTGVGRVFRNAEITPDVLLASACLPTMFQAVEIDGEAYWDGGFVGNPTITPLVRETDSHDTILVQINPIVRDAVPKTAREILNRLNEVAFNAPLVKELRMIALLNKVADVGDGEGRRWAQMRIHRIASDRVSEVDSSSKLITEWPFLLKLRDEGRRCAELFLAEHGSNLGKRSTLDLDAMISAC